MIYSHREVKWLVEHYQDYLDPNPKLNSDMVIKFADIKTFYRGLPETTREILFACGVLGLDKITVGWMVDLHRNTVHRQYKAGLQHLTCLMNGTIYDPEEVEDGEPD